MWEGGWGWGRGDGSSLVAEKGHSQEDQGLEQPSRSSPAHPLCRWETEAQTGLFLCWSEGKNRLTVEAD